MAREALLIAGAAAIGLAIGIWTWAHLRLRRSARPWQGCPKCGAVDRRRVHRSPADHLFGLGLNVRRYRCTNRACNWQGLVKRDL